MNTDDEKVLNQIADRLQKYRDYIVTTPLSDEEIDALAGRVGLVIPLC